MITQGILEGSKTMEKSKKRKTYEFIADPVLFAATKMNPALGASYGVGKAILKNIKKKNYSNTVRKPIYY